jgi:hypothetical protein
MELHQHFEFRPASQDPFSFCQIQFALDTVYSKGAICLSRLFFKIGLFTVYSVHT